VARELGIADSCLSNGRKQEELDGHTCDDGLTGAEREELRKRVRRLDLGEADTAKSRGLLRPGERDPVTAASVATSPMRG
jgi:hypothetical protein